MQKKRLKNQLKSILYNSYQYLAMNASSDKERWLTVTYTGYHYVHICATIEFHQSKYVSAWLLL